MNQLEEGRAVIDRVDQEFVKLFEERFAAVEQIADYKLEHDLAVLDAARETAIIEKRTQEVAEPLRPYFMEWYREMLKQSREYHKKRIESYKKQK